MDKYILYWWTYGDILPNNREYDNFTEAKEHFKNLYHNDEVGRISLRRGDIEIEGSVTSKYLEWISNIIYVDTDSIKEEEDK